NFTNIHHFLNTSTTSNNTFYVYIRDGNDDNTQWRWADDVAVPDAIDEQDAYEYNPGLQLITPSGNPIDLTLKVDLAPLDNTPKPTDLGLKINNSAVTDSPGGSNSGYWNPSERYSSSSDEIKFDFSADWWEVSCNITEVKLNYTKTDKTANSSYFISGSSQDAVWNVTRDGGLNFFDSRITSYNSINFTIPATWSDGSIKVFNSSDERTLTLKKRLLGNGYREIEIPNAGNGTYWYLTASSANLLSSIDTYIGSTSAIFFNYTDILHFNATFSTEISDGSINLSVYSPAAINNELNYSIKVVSFTAGSEISISDWDISNNVTQYGNFRTHIYWSNSTAAGFLEKVVTILGETGLVPSLPATIFDASDTFVIDLFFNDTGLDIGIPGATITYRLDGGTPKSTVTDLGNGNYQITVNCSDPDFSDYGPNLIEINANKAFYNNQSETEQIIIRGETNLISSIPKSSFNSTETFNVSLFLNDTVKDSGVNGAIRNVYVNSTPFTPISNFDYGDGNYNITIDCDADYFDTWNYGHFNLSVVIEKAYYHNHTGSSKNLCEGSFCKLISGIYPSFN
ncbi:MAG: hypothetical protein ACXAAI_16290, partial [Promethearchaeota archaeon]